MNDNFFKLLYPLPSDIIAIHEMFVEIAEKYDLLASRGNRTAARQARLVISAYQDFMADLERIAERTVLVANEIIPQFFDQARVGRPAQTGTSMRTALDTSEKVDTGLPTGTVGIVSVDALDKFVYWRTQEFGSDHLVGAELQGFFFGPGGPHPADPAQFRYHALFRPGNGPPMRVKNEIPEGRFIRDGRDQLHKYWSAQMLAAGQDAISDLRTVEGLTRLTPSSRARRGRNFENLRGRFRSARGNPAQLGAVLRRL